MTSPSGIRFEGSAFWVRHRHREYGPFDYEWSADLHGIELLYRRRKFGEFCSTDQMYADMKEFNLPMRVVEVTSVVCGSIVYGLLNGFSRDEKARLIQQFLASHGMDRFGENLEGWQD